MICLKNASDTTFTDNDGRFHFDRVTANDTLIIAYSSRFDAVIPVGNTKDLSITLSKKNFVAKGEQTSITGEYQRSQKKMPLNNIITREMIEESSASNIYDIFRFGIPGVKVTDNSEGSRITIRGTTSFDPNREPLFVIDGLYFESSAEVDIRVNVSEIEKIEILKDGAGYGVKGGYGVIVITLKK